MLLVDYVSICWYIYCFFKTQLMSVQRGLGIEETWRLRQERKATAN